MQRYRQDESRDGAAGVRRVMEREFGPAMTADPPVTNPPTADRSRDTAEGTAVVTSEGGKTTAPHPPGDIACDPGSELGAPRAKVAVTSAQVPIRLIGHRSEAEPEISSEESGLTSK